MKSNPWFVVIIVIALLFVVSSISALILGIFVLASVEDFSAGNVARIELSGPITAEPLPGLFSDGSASEDIVKLIEKADADDSVEAMLIVINSPGGSAVASAEIGNALKKTNKTTVSVIREVGASGGYWVASTTDHVIASPLSITGSIGVIGSYLDLSGFIERYNISYQRLVAGEYKDVGTPFRPLEADEEERIQAILDKIHDAFITEVAANRNLDEAQVRELATGMIYLGSEAFELGLIDELGDEHTATAYLESELNTTIEIAEYSKQLSFFESLSEVSAGNFYAIGRGFGQTLLGETRI